METSDPIMNEIAIEKVAVLISALLSERRAFVDCGNVDKANECTNRLNELKQLRTKIYSGNDDAVKEVLSTVC